MGTPMAVLVLIVAYVLSGAIIAGLIQRWTNLDFDGVDGPPVGLVIAGWPIAAAAFAVFLAFSALEAVGRFSNWVATAQLPKRKQPTVDQYVIADQDLPDDTPWDWR